MRHSVEYKKTRYLCWVRVSKYLPNINVWPFFFFFKWESVDEGRKTSMNISLGFSVGSWAPYKRDR